MAIQSAVACSEAKDDGLLVSRQLMERVLVWVVSFSLAVEDGFLFIMDKSFAALVIPDQLVPCYFSSASVSCLQLLRGRPLFLFPWGFQVRAWHVVLDAGFLRVCLIQPHFLRSICLATGSCPTHSHRSSFRIFSWVTPKLGHKSSGMCLDSRTVHIHFAKFPALRYFVLTVPGKLRLFSVCSVSFICLPGGWNSSLVVCWAHCPAWCSVVGSILLWGEFFR